MLLSTYVQKQAAPATFYERFMAGSKLLYDFLHKHATSAYNLAKGHFPICHDQCKNHATQAYGILKTKAASGQALFTANFPKAAEQIKGQVALVSEKVGAMSAPILSGNRSRLLFVFIAVGGLSWLIYPFGGSFEMIRDENGTMSYEEMWREINRTRSQGVKRLKRFKSLLEPGYPPQWQYLGQKTVMIYNRAQKCGSGTLQFLLQAVGNKDTGDLPNPYFANQPNNMVVDWCNSVIRDRPVIKNALTTTLDPKEETSRDKI